MRSIFRKFCLEMLEALYALLKVHPLTTSAKVNEELSKIIALLLRDFISMWYDSLTNDQEFYLEIIQTIATLTQEIERRLLRVEWVTLFVHDLPKILKTHLQDYRTCCTKLGTAYAPDKSLEELFYGMQPHAALLSPDAEKEYMRRISEILVDTLIPENELQSDGVRVLIREILCNTVLLMLMDTLSEPNFWNELILKVSY